MGRSTLSHFHNRCCCSSSAHSKSTGCNTALQTVTIKKICFWILESCRHVSSLKNIAELVRNVDQNSRKIVHFLLEMYSRIRCACSTNRNHFCSGTRVYLDYIFYWKINKYSQIISSMFVRLRAFPKITSYPWISSENKCVTKKIILLYSMNLILHTFVYSFNMH